MTEGLLYIMRRDEWCRMYPDVNPLSIGCRESTVFGESVLTAYHDYYYIHDNFWNLPALFLALELESLYSRLKDCDPTSRGRREIEREIARIEQNPDLAHSRQCLEAQRWFQEKAERIQIE
jgi:hypothetical protein